MRIVEFSEGTLRFLDSIPAQAPPSGFIWVYLDRESLQQRLPELQDIAQRLGGSTLLDLHVKDAKEWQRDPKQLRRLGF